MTRAVAAALVGTVLERRYRIDTFIGAGEKGAFVFRAHEIMTGEHVAVRCPGVPDDLEGLDYEQALDAFLGEAKILEKASKTSEDIESLLAYGIAEPSGSIARFPFCVFEWLEGKPLEQHILEGGGSAPSIGEALAILEPAARALAAVHALGVTHKDVRPRNLWLASVGARTKMKLTQFVLASRIGGSDDAFAPEYAAPEHFKRSYGPVGPHTDVYGLALCLVELLSGGRRALEGHDATELYLATSDLVRRPTLRARGVQISDAVEAVIAKAVAVDPKRRWQNVRELWDALVAAVPELTPLMPSVRPRESAHTLDGGGETSGGSNPPSGKHSSSVPSMWSARDQSGAVIMPADDARLGDSAKISAFSPPANRDRGEKKDRTNLFAWLIVALLGAAAVAVIVLKLMRAAPGSPTTTKAPTTQPSGSSSTGAVAAPDAAAKPASSSSASKSSDSTESAVVLRPFLTDMIRVPAGKFMMGTDKEGKPAHAVKITKSFFIDRTEVTAEMYSACIEEGACTPPRVHSGDGVESAWGCNEVKDHPKYPANCVDRAQAERFCVFSQKRLPSEAEWEYAARGTDGRDYPWGNTPPTSCTTAIIVGLMGECRDRKGPMEVAHAPDGRSAFGALDMAGNVWEWVADGYEVYPTTEVTDPHVPISSSPSGKGVLRGGSWDYSPLSAKSTFRYPFQANVGNVSTGFRCARDGGGD